jgi:hypothetical protein
MTSRLISLAREAGPAGLFAGLGPRMIMTAGLVSSQFIMYGYIKSALGARPGIEVSCVWDPRACRSLISQDPQGGAGAVIGGDVRI